MPAEIKGLHQKHTHPLMRVGPKGFEWPEEPSAKVREEFSAALNELLREKNMSHMDLAIKLYGKQAHAASDYRPPRNHLLTRGWVTNKLFPSEKHAGWIAMGLNVALARLLQPKGKFEPLPDLRARNGGAHASPKGKSRNNGNGSAHRGNGAHHNGHEPSPLPQLPDDAEPANVTMQTHESDPRFVVVSVKGTLPVDIAMSMFALIHPRPQE